MSSRWQETLNCDFVAKYVFIMFVVLSSALLECHQQMSIAPIVFLYLIFLQYNLQKLGFKTV